MASSASQGHRQHEGFRALATNRFRGLDEGRRLEHRFKQFQPIGVEVTTPGARLAQPRCDEAQGTYRDDRQARRGLQPDVRVPPGFGSCEGCPKGQLLRSTAAAITAQR